MRTWRRFERRDNMTREEAAHIVDVAFGVPQAVRRAGEDRTYHEKEIREAKDMAIKALEQNGDFEIKQRIIDAITAKIDEKDDEKPDVIIGLITAIGVIKNLPDATESEVSE
jgi:hypothetical protein